MMTIWLALAHVYDVILRLTPIAWKRMSSMWTEIQVVSSFSVIFSFLLSFLLSFLFPFPFFFFLLHFFVIIKVISDILRNIQLHTELLQNGETSHHRRSLSAWLFGWPQVIMILMIRMRRRRMMMMMIRKRMMIMMAQILSMDCVCANFNRIDRYLMINPLSRYLMKSAFDDCNVWVFQVQVFDDSMYEYCNSRYWMIDENFIEFCCLDKLVERRDAIQVQIVFTWYTYRCSHKGSQSVTT